MEVAAAQFVMKSRALRSLFVPMSKWYMNATTYRHYGLQFDDILMEENPEMQEALRRLPLHQSYERHFRHKYAIQLSLGKTILPKEQYTTDAQDKPYLQETWQQVMQEKEERDGFDNPQPKTLFG